jgi:2-polyprenyl-3-methyl-5-hydroxy-6-metoxy-1,4-benzoquinol methylase
MSMVSAGRYSVPVDASDIASVHGAALALVGHNQRVLEFGCGEGHVTEALRDRGCTVVGIERDARAAEMARQFAAQVQVADLDTEDYVGAFNGQLFDVALFGDVLEHLRNPLRVLRAVRRVLAPGTGFVVLSVPNIAHVDVRLALLEGRFDYAPCGLLDETHLRFFTRKSLERLIDQAGFVVVDLRRVIRRAFDTEVAADRSGVPSGALEQALEDPEAETYQFVMRAVPSDTAPNVRGSAARVLLLEDEALRRARQHELEIAALEDLVRAACQRRIDADGARGQVEGCLERVTMQLTGAERALEAAREQEAAARLAIARSEAELEAFRRTKLFRWTAGARSLYATARRRNQRT